MAETKGSSVGQEIVKAVDIVIIETVKAVDTVINEVLGGSSKK